MLARLMDHSQAVTIFACVLLAGACSSSDNNATPDAGATVDAKVVIDLALGSDAAASCGAGIYPCGPYGTQQGEVIANEKFTGWSDPDTFCKDSKDKVLDIDTVRNFSFKSWFDKPDKCPEKKKKLLWVMVSAGWCGPCIAEINEVMAQYRTGAFDSRVEVIDILFEDDNGDPATPAFAKVWANQLKLTYPLLLDPTFKMGKYFSREAVPFNMLVDLETMKVFYAQTGNNLPAMGQQVQAFLTQ